ncbi:MAG: 16S rRNA (cytidine(1402)-2'-O)-methyltransferase [Micrococcales bacterium]|nr:MAG: 16S rRNA (cytidine(1402)-2'-O)-methyltransferase [Micrococcales bacterium]PIE27165.1 MAG: 16S rRNA (cytidine(1402)-2'-O)-methyltransferase [Micrococcales bacterium]
MADEDLAGTPAGVLVLAATPIGDAEDASPRLRHQLGSADVLAAEDTRRLHRLLSTLGVRPAGRVVSHHAHNEAASTAELVRLMADEGQCVVLVSDAGMPTLSDPGYRLTTAAVEAGVRVTALPGPSASLTALAVSGLPAAKFCFEGFLPRRAGERERTLAGLAGETRTMIFFEAPHRLGAALRAMADELGDDRAAALCRELTKTHEQVLRAPLGELWEWSQANQVLGEITLVVAGLTPQPPSTADLVIQVRDRTEDGQRLKDAVKEVAKMAGVSARELYEVCHDPQHAAD